MSHLWVILTAAACVLPCSVLGCFLVLRRMSLLGDAITHAILPGLVIGFAVSGSRGLVPMLIGAGLTGVLTALLSAALTRWGRVDPSAALGVVFSSMFAIGVLLINRYARNVDLDPGCVLYGVIETVSFDTTTVLGIELPRALLSLSIVAAVVLIGVAVFFKELRIVSFDPALATTLGISAAAVHYGLMAAVAATSVASFEAVGSVLVVAMLVAPGAAAQMLTDRLRTMVVLAMLIGIVDVLLGYLAAYWLNTSVAGAIAAAAGAVFLLCCIAAPRYGIVSKLIGRFRLSVRIAEEDILGRCYRADEQGATVAAEQLLRPSFAARTAMRRLVRSGRIALQGTDKFAALTAQGVEQGRGIVRSHRLWETFLAKESPLPIDHLHGPSERTEHFISPEMQAELARDVGGVDPHGKTIPPLDGR